MALIIGTWFWGTKYGLHYVKRLRNSVDRNLTMNHRFDIWQPTPADELLRDGCLCRLKMFSPDWQADHGIVEGDKIVCLDLDSVITGKLDPVFDRDEDFVILQGANAANPCPYNGSVMMLRAGKHAEVWGDFTLERVQHIPYYEFPDDQGWIWHKIPNAAGWKVGPSSGVYAFRKPAWPRDDRLPADARLVAFPGKRDPSQFMHVPWIADHWQ